MNITLDNDDKEIIIESLLLKIKGISDQLESEVSKSEQRNQESTNEILKLYKFIETKGQTDELLDFAYDSAKKGALDDIDVALALFDYHSHSEISEKRWCELTDLKKKLEEAK